MPQQGHKLPTGTMSRRALLVSSAGVLAGLTLQAREVFGQQRPASAGPLPAALVEDLVAGNRVLARHGVVDAYGHISVRHPGNPNRFVLSRSLAPALVTADDLIEYDLDSNPVNANGRSEYSERPIHGEIYKARPDVNSVVHAHAQSVVAFTVTGVPIRPVYHMAGFIADGLPNFDIRTAAGMTDMLVRTPDRGRALAQALGPKPAVLMRGHGVAVVGPSIPFAVGRSVYLEANARVQLAVLGLNGPVTYLDPAEAAEIAKSGENRSYERPWELWKREVMGR